MAVNSTQQGCDAFSAVDLADEGNTVPQCKLPAVVSNLIDVYEPIEGQLPVDDQMDGQTYVKKMVESTADYSKCSEKYVDIENGKLVKPGINEEIAGNLKNGEGQTKSLQKQTSFGMGDGYMQFLMNHSLILPKYSARGEKVAEGSRMRKHKRTASFNSRKVALMFSVLRKIHYGHVFEVARWAGSVIGQNRSSLGTMILIYLTLKVKQMTDASIHSE